MTGCRLRRPGSRWACVRPTRWSNAAGMMEQRRGPKPRWHQRKWPPTVPRWRRSGRMLWTRSNTTGRWHDGSPRVSSSTVNTLRAKAVQDNVVHAFMAWRAISGSGDPTQINPLDPLYFASHLDGMMTVLSHSIEGGVGTLTRRAVSVNRAEVILGDAAAEVTDMVDYIALRRSSGRLMQGRHLIV